jgi:hypothetical protein
MNASPSASDVVVPSAGHRHAAAGTPRGFYGSVARLRALARAAVFFLKVFPMLPSAPVDWVTKRPVVGRVRYPTQTGQAEGDLYRPGSPGPHPGIVVCLGVVPFEVDHPQVPVLGKALARAGFAALLYWSPSMRDFRLRPDDIENIALAYDWLIQQPGIDASRSGLLGTCVGGSFALMASAHPLIRDRLAFVSAYAPFSSMQTFARDIASGTRSTDHGPEPWKVDQLTRKVFVHSVTASLEPGEADRLRAAFAAEGGHFDGGSLSPDGQAVYSLLTANGPAEASFALDRLPDSLRAQLAALSPMKYLSDIHARLIPLLHDESDQVIPVGESRRLVAALSGREGVSYTEMHFQHLDPTRGRLPLFRLVREFARFFTAVIPIFQQTP